MKTNKAGILRHFVVYVICMTLLIAQPFEIIAADKTIKKTEDKKGKKVQDKKDKKSKKDKKNEVTITGREIKEKKVNLLMKELKRKPYKPSKGRRFEIIFFISFPALLFLTYTLMDFFVSNTSSYKNNPKREMQSTHYFYIVSTSLITSIYIAYNDSLKAFPSDKNNLAKERKFSMPLVFLRF